MRERAYVAAALSSVAILVGGCGGAGTASPASVGAGSGGSGAAAGASHGGDTFESSGGAEQGGAAESTGGAAQGGATSPDGGSAQGGALTAGGASGGSNPNLYIDLIRTNVPDGCWPRSVPFGAVGTAEAGRVACSVGEAFFTSCDCTKPGLAPAPEYLLTAFKAAAKGFHVCDDAGQPACASACACEILQPEGTSADEQSALYACQNDVTPPADVAGFCFIDATTPTAVGNPEIVSNCPSNDRRRLRFVGPGLPDASAQTFIGCTATPLGG